jgi:hypothetical protein
MRHLNRQLFLVSLLFTAMTVEAAQLGSAKGSAVFGRPLDLSVQVRLDAPAEDAASCFNADVFQADNKFDVGRVRLDVVPAANGLDATVRIRSVTAVNEPWAKVILRSNCGSKVTRQYDFLTDFAADIPTSNTLAESSSAPAQIQTSNPEAITTSPLAALGKTKSARTSAQAPISNWSVKRSQVKAQLADVNAVAPKQNAKSVASTSVATKKTTEMVADAVGQSRLKMETFELTDERQVLLKLSTALIAPTGMRTPEEIQALAQATAVWRAINGMPAIDPAAIAPAAAAATASPVTTEAQVKAPAVEVPPVTLPTLMNQKLAGKSDFSNLMVYGLIGLLALTLGLIAWLWLRVRKATRAGYGWLNDAVADENELDHEPTQFLPSNFHETETVAEDDLEPAFEAQPKQVQKSEWQYEPEPVTVREPKQDLEPEEIVINMAEDLNEASVVSKPELPVVNALPAHFDDPRFDERVLRVKKKDRSQAHEKPITSTAELMELVLADTPPKLRSVSSLAPEPAEKPSISAQVTVVDKVTKTKDDSKSNLIDFDVFAEPEPLNKPSRFVR